MTKAKITLRSPFRISCGAHSVGLTDCEGYLLWAFMARRSITLEGLAEIIWGREFNRPLTWENSVGVRLNKLRRRIEPFGFGVHCSARGRGRIAHYSLVKGKSDDCHERSDRAGGGGYI